MTEPQRLYAAESDGDRPGPFGVITVQPEPDSDFTVTRLVTANQDKLPGNRRSRATAVPRRARGGFGPRRKDDQEFSAFVRRAIRAYARRVTAADPAVLAQMVALKEDLDRELDQAITSAARSLRDQGYTWSEIGQEVGIAKQHAWRRWGQDR